MRAGLLIASLGMVASAPMAAWADDAATFKTLIGGSFVVATVVDGHTVGGPAVTEKHTPRMICQRSLAAGHKAKPLVACFRKIDTASANAIYEALQVRPVSLGFTTSSGGFPFVGSSTSEKRDGGLLCRRVTPSTPDPVISYSCYAR